MTDLVLDVPAVGVLGMDRITQIREEGKQPRDVDWRVTHRGDVGCREHEASTGVHVQWVGSGDSTGAEEFNRSTWLTVRRVMPGPLPPADAALAALWEAITTGRAAPQRELAPARQPGADQQNGYCAYCEMPIRQAPTGWAHVGASCGFTAKPIPAPFSEGAGVSV